MGRIRLEFVDNVAKANSRERLRVLRVSEALANDHLLNGEQQIPHEEVLHVDGLRDFALFLADDLILYSKVTRSTDSTENDCA
jgi:hypothetical protein